MYVCLVFVCVCLTFSVHVKNGIVIVPFLVCCVCARACVCFCERAIEVDAPLFCVYGASSLSLYAGQCEWSAIPQCVCVCVILCV